MLRTPQLVMAVMAALFISAAPASTVKSVNSGCTATGANFIEGKWVLSCSSTGSCGENGSCGATLSRDSQGSFLACRCSNSGVSPCCQVVYRYEEQGLEAHGDCETCGAAGTCELGEGSDGGFTGKCGSGGGGGQ